VRVHNVLGSYHSDAWLREAAQPWPEFQWEMVSSPTMLYIAGGNEGWQ